MDEFWLPCVCMKPTSDDPPLAEIKKVAKIDRALEGGREGGRGVKQKNYMCLE